MLTASVAAGNQQCHHANTSDHDLVDDIGKLFFIAKSPVEFCKSAQALSFEKKYNLLTNHKKPRANYIFPPKCIGGRNRAFRPVWLSEHPCMVTASKWMVSFALLVKISVLECSRGSLYASLFVIGTRKQKSKEARAVLIPSSSH